MGFTRSVVILAILVSVNSECIRDYDEEALGPDCSTITGECHYLYESGIPTEIPYPPSNMWRCYRTCFNGDQCQASHVHANGPKPLRLRNGFRRVVSPRNPDPYRPSTDCRYHILCEPGEWISVSVVHIDLQERVSCSHQVDDQENVCVDFVKIAFYDQMNEQSYCGNENGPINGINHNRITFQFASNRETEGGGFMYHVRCMPSNITASAQSCTRPRGSQPNNHKPKKLIVDPTKDPQGFIVQMTWSMVYKKSLIEVRDENNQIVHTLKGIRQLNVEDVSKQLKTIYCSLDSTTYHGYGFLATKEGIAFYFQTGVNPDFNPSLAEIGIIRRIEFGLDIRLGFESFDVKDELDPDENTYRRFFTKMSAIEHLKLSIFLRHVRKLALMYGNACNPVLRKVACTYQESVLKRNCNSY